MRIPSSTGGAGGCGLVFGLFFIGVGAVPIAFVMMGPTPNLMFAAGMSVFILIGGIMALMGVIGLMTAAKFNPVFFELATPPRVGTELVGHVEAAFGAPPTANAKCLLECTVTTRRPRAGRGGSNVHAEKLLSTAFEVPTHAMTHSGGRLRIPVQILLPGGLPPTGPGMDSTGRMGSVTWSFRCNVEGPGVDFRSVFPLTTSA